MNYHILNSLGGKIASFVILYDRDVCIDALREAFEDDGAFQAKDDD